MPSDDLVVRVADTDDIAAVASLHLAWGDGAHDDEIPDFERHLAEWIAAEGERRTVWLAELAGEPVGMATLYEFRRMPRHRAGSRLPHGATLGNMFVREDRRNRGIGSELIRAVIDAHRSADTCASCCRRPADRCRSTGAPGSSRPTARPAGCCCYGPVPLS